MRSTGTHSGAVFDGAYWLLSPPGLPAFEIYCASAPRISSHHTIIHCTTCAIKSLFRQSILNIQHVLYPRSSSQPRNGQEKAVLLFSLHKSWMWWSGSPAAHRLHGYSNLCEWRLESGQLLARHQAQNYVPSWVFEHLLCCCTTVSRRPDLFTVRRYLGTSTPRHSSSRVRDAPTPLVTCPHFCSNKARLPFSATRRLPSNGTTPRKPVYFPATK